MRKKAIKRGLQCSKVRQQEKWIEKAHIKYNHKFDYSKIVYVSVSTDVIVGCPDHGYILCTPHKHLHSIHGCPSCAREYSTKVRTLSTTTWIAKATIVHAGIYDYSESVYLTSQKPIAIICKRHGKYTQSTADSHLSGHGCPACKVFTTGEWIEKAVAVHGGTYDYSESIYTNTKHPIDIICKAHGKYTQSSAAHHIQGKGCPICGERKRYGETNPNYKHGRSKEYQRERNTPEVREWTRLLKATVNKCDCCDVVFSVDFTAHAHHLNSWVSNIEQRYDLNNGAVLCNYCHGDFHEQYGYGYNTKEQYYQFKQIRQMEIGA